MSVHADKDDVTGEENVHCDHVGGGLKTGHPPATGTGGGPVVPGQPQPHVSTSLSLYTHSLAWHYTHSHIQHYTIVYLVIINVPCHCWGKW